MHPVVITLRAWIRDMSCTYVKDLFEEHRLGQNRFPQFGPVLAAATSDQIVDGGKAQLLMIEVAMDHGCALALQG